MHCWSNLLDSDSSCEKYWKWRNGMHSKGRAWASLAGREVEAALVGDTALVDDTTGSHHGRHRGREVRRLL